MPPLVEVAGVNSVSWPVAGFSWNPLSDALPGDLIFYGSGGSEHVAMYVSSGTMIEAPETGQSVHLTGLRLGDGFVGAGRP